MTTQPLQVPDNPHTEPQSESAFDGDGGDSLRARGE
jgi:hypothetical protein